MSEPSSAIPVVPMSPARRLRILVLDDSEVPRFVLCQLLQKMGHEISDFADGASALAALASASFDLAILDVMMPEMDGPATAAAIRASGRPWADIPLLAATASPIQVVEASCRAAGIGEILPKPVSYEQLKLAIDRFLPPPPPAGVS